MARKQESNLEDALKRAYRFLDYRPRSEAEVRIKLTQLGFSQPIIETTLEKLRSLKFLDDEAFARGWALGRVQGRGFGPLRVERELQQKGVAETLISQIVQETFSRQGGIEVGKKLLERRFKDKDLGDVKVLRRAVAFLKRCGYQISVIAELVEQARPRG